MYPDVKYITEAEFQRLKKLDTDKFTKNEYKLPKRIRKSYYAASRKKIQRTLNYYVRMMNKAIQDDYLWRGRFFIRQIGFAPFHRFEDGSGGEMFVHLRIFDKQTEKYVDKFDSAGSLCFMGGADIAMFMNDAIVKAFNVWKEDKDSPLSPYNDRILYSSIPDEYIIKNATPLREFNYI